MNAPGELFNTFFNTIHSTNEHAASRSTIDSTLNMQHVIRCGVLSPLSSSLKSVIDSYVLKGSKLRAVDVVQHIQEEGSGAYTRTAITYISSIVLKLDSTEKVRGQDYHRGCEALLQLYRSASTLLEKNQMWLFDYAKKNPSVMKCRPESSIPLHLTFALNVADMYFFRPSFPPSEGKLMSNSGGGRHDVTTTVHSIHSLALVQTHLLEEAHRRGIFHPDTLPYITACRTVLQHFFSCPTTIASNSTASLPVESLPRVGGGVVAADNPLKRHTTETTTPKKVTLTKYKKAA